MSVVLLLTILATTNPGPATFESDSLGGLPLATIARYFGEFDSSCARDAGTLWGVSYAGPMVIVDPMTRRVAANQADSTGVLTRRNGVFLGALPPEVPIANTAVNWLGIRWTMLMAGSLSPNLRPRTRLMGHEAFHRIQPRLGLEAVGPTNDHLDARDGRFWLQMEWHALERALLVSGMARTEALQDARRFRAVRRAQFPGAGAREVPLEIHEGIAEYAGARLAGYSDSLIVRVVAARRASETSFVRSFAYVSGPLYGFVLDGTGTEWRRRLSPTTDLAEMLASALRLPPLGKSDLDSSTARRRARAYGGDSLWATETGREQERARQREEWRRTLVEGPVLILSLAQVHSGSFDPGGVFPMEGVGIVYTTRVLTADWGELVVENGAILELGSSSGRVSLAHANAERTEGTGWKLRLAEGWRITPALRNGDFELTTRTGFHRARDKP